MVGVAAMEEKKCRKWKGMHGIECLCCVLCCGEWNELYECIAWFYRERMDGRTCEWQLGMIKEGNACVMTTRLVGGNLKMQMGMLEMQGRPRQGGVWCACG